MDPTYTPEEAIRAIEARVTGDFTSPQLERLGPLSASPIKDIKRIVRCTDMPEPRQFTVVLTYETAAWSPEDALHMALSVISGQDGGFYEVNTADQDIVIHGEIICLKRKET